MENFVQLFGETHSFSTCEIRNKIGGIGVLGHPKIVLLICSMPGPDGKSFPLCPYCYSNPPFEGIEALINTAKTGSAGKIGKGSGIVAQILWFPRVYVEHLS